MLSLIRYIPLHTRQFHVGNYHKNYLHLLLTPVRKPIRRQSTMILFVSILLPGSDKLMIYKNDSKFLVCTSRNQLSAIATVAEKTVLPACRSCCTNSSHHSQVKTHCTEERHYSGHPWTGLKDLNGEITVLGLFHIKSVSFT